MKYILKFSYLYILIIVFISCQKMDQPALGKYPTDANPVGGPLKFYAAFDGTTTNIYMNAVDSVRANFPADNPMTQIDGISGKAISGDGTKFVKYAGANDFPSTASSFTVSFWEKRNGNPPSDAEFPFSISSSNGNWAGASMFVLFDHAGSGATAQLAVVKFYIVDKDLNDTWLAWDGSNRVPGIQDNNWHHLAFVYDATTSKLTMYVDGVANANVPQWGTHGPVNLDASKITGLEIAGRPKEDLGWGKSWNGSLDQFRMYGTALSASEVQALYTGKK